MESRKGNFLDYVLILIAVFFWGMSFIWSDEVIDHGVPIFSFIFVRMIMASLALLVFALITGKMQKIRKGDLKWFLLMVFFEPFIYFLGESFGLKITNSPTLASVIIATIPVFSLIVGQIVFKEKLTAFNKIGIFVTVMGVILFVLLGGSIHTDYFYGVLVFFLSVIGSTGYSAVCKKLTAHYNPVAIVTYQFIFAAGFFLIPFLIWGLPVWDGELIFSKPVMVPIVELALLCSGVAFIFYVNSVDKIGMTKSVIFTSLCPVVSATAAFFLGQDNIRPWQIVGIVMAIAGVVMAQRKKI